MRTVEVSSPKLGRLSDTLALLNRVEQERLDVATAARQLLELETAPRRWRRYRLLAMLAPATGRVIFLNGFSPSTMLVALLASLLTAPVMPAVVALGNSMARSRRVLVGALPMVPSPWPRTGSTGPSTPGTGDPE